MARKPDLFSLSPVTTMLPVTGDVARLEGSVSSLFARYEVVEKALRTVVDDSELESLGRERAMLLEVLNWLSVDPDGGGR